MSQNARVILVLLILVGGVGAIAWFALQDSPAIPDAPSDQGAGEEASPVPQVQTGRPGVLTGEVRVFKTGEPAADIEIRIEGAGKPITRKTNPRGIFAAKVRSGPLVTVTVIAPRPYASVVISDVTVKADETVSLGTLYLERALLVRGIVVDRTGAPVAGAAVTAYRPTVGDAPATDFLEVFTNITKARPSIDSTFADGDGRFALSRLSPGTYRIEARAKGFAIGSVAKATVSTESERVVHRIVLGPGYRLDGDVTTANGVPVPGALVSVFSFGMGRRGEFDFSPVQTETDDEGRFEFTNLSPGRAQLAVRADGYPMKMENRVNIGQQTSASIVLGGTSTMEGRITSKKGDPIEGASISVAIGRRGGAFGEATSDADGRYRMENLPDGRIQFMRVEAVGYASFPVIDNPMMFQRGFGDLPAGGTLQKDIQLDSGARVFGRVTSQADGQPIEGATVYVLSVMSAFLGSTGQTVTDENGDYEVTGVGKGLYQVAVKSPGFYQMGLDPRFMQRAFMGVGKVAEGAPEVKLAEGGPDQRLDVALMQGAVAVGTVVAPDNSPVPGARVTIAAKPDAGGMTFGGPRRAAGPTGITDENGRFKLTGLEAGNAVKFEAEAEEWVKGESEPIALAAGQETSGVVVRLRAGGVITGTLTSFEGGPLAGAEVRAMAQPSNAAGNPWQWEWQLRSVEPVLTDAQGRFRVASLTPGPHILRAEAPKHRAVTKMDLQVPEGGDVGPVTLKLEKGLAISGVVVDPEGKPVEGVNLWTNIVNRESGATGANTFRNATTDETGTFDLDQLEPGDYDITVNSSGYANRTLNGIAAGTADLRIVLEKGKSISGRVLLPDGSPAASIWVTAQGSENASSSSNDRTDDDGKFAIDNLPDGTYTVRANTGGAFRFGGGGNEGPSLLPAIQEGVVAGTSNVELRLSAGATLEGTVTDEAGNPVPVATVFARELGGGDSTGWGQTDEKGEFRVTGLAPGARFSVTANHSDYGPVPPVEADGDGAALMIVLPPKPEVPDVPDVADQPQPTEEPR